MKFNIGDLIRVKKNGSGYEYLIVSPIQHNVFDSNEKGLWLYRARKDGTLSDKATKYNKRSRISLSDHWLETHATFVKHTNLINESDFL